MASTDDPRTKALTLALAGVDWATIAERLDYPDAVTALEAALDAAEEQYSGAPIDPQRLLEVLRLDRLRAAVWPAAMKGDMAAVQTALAIGDRKVRMLRLNNRSGD